MAAQTQPDIREYVARARSTDTFGRVLCNARDHYFVIDGPVQNGCPGEEVTPGEMFVAAIASCGVELVQVIARKQEIPLGAIRVGIRGVMDRNNPVRPDLTVFQSVRMEFHLEGVSEGQGA